MARIGWYLLFLVAYAGYSWLVQYVQKWKIQVLTSRKGRAFFADQMMMIGGLIPLVLIPWILTGFFSPSFLLALVVAFEFGALLISFSNRLAHVTSREVALRVTLWISELTIKHPAMVTLSMMLLGLFIIVGYLIAISYVYFANPLNSQQAVRGVLSVSMVLYLVGTIFIGASGIVQIASPLVSNSIRRALFVAQAASALPMGVVLTVYLGLMGIGSERFLPASFRLPSEFSQYLPLMVLILFYVIILIVPYFIGLEGRRRFEVAVYRDSVDRVTKVIDVVGVPSSQDVNQLTQLRAQLKQEADEWKGNEPIFQIAAEGKNLSALDENTRVIVEAYEMFKNQDPRCINLRAMEDLDQKLEEMIGEYQRIAQARNRLQLSLELGRSLEAHFKDRKVDIEGKMRAAEDMKVLTPVLARLAAVLGATPVILQFGQRIIELLPIVR